ncbi:MAG: GDP-mannose 4,6-dehydratase [Verrucomicrobia bacterium]|nr:GDP-mannose 4,6-dehydratase [Verrucomicrobiota bacterium]
MHENKRQKKILITGITGQTGSYLADLFISEGCEVHGIVRRASSFNRSRIEHLRANPEIYGKKLFLHYSDLDDSTTIRRILFKTEPDELYHLAGQSHVGLSFEIPESTCQETASATLAILEICRDLKNPPRIYHASSSEVFGSPSESPQKETTAFRPATPYGCAKAFATNMASVYRRAHGLFVCNGIAYNHESPRRGENFVTCKIAAAAAAHARGRRECLELGNLNAERDWGYAPEFARAMAAMLHHDSPDDYVIATGHSSSVREFALAAYRAVGIELAFEGSGHAEVGFEMGSGKVFIRVNPHFYRPVEPTRLVGDSSKALEILGWRASITAKGVAEIMARAEMDSQSR